MDDEFFRKHNMHVCLQCNKPSTIYTSAAHLRNHRENKHTTTDNNLDIVLKTYRHASEHVKTNWKQGLAFLHRLQPSPPPFRRSTWHRLKHPQRKEYFVTYNNVVTWVLEATTPLGESIVRDTQPHPSLIDSAPFWKLLLLLEPLLLGPIQHTQHRKHSAAIRERVNLLKEGRLQELHEMVWNPPTQPPPKHRKKKTHRRHNNNNTIDPSRIKAAQQAADVGNYSTAFSRLTTHMPTAKLTPARVATIQKELFPPRRDPPPLTRTRGCRPVPPPTDQFLKLSPNLFELSLRMMKPGTASGPYATSTDAIVTMALHRTARTPNATRPYFRNLQDLFQLLVTAQLPPSVHPLLSSNYFLALHKDPAKPEKLRPIGIGTALRRIAAKTALLHCTDDIRPLLLQAGQYGIQIPGGIDFVAHTTTNHVQQYITEPSTPTRALVLLDLHNMFNNTSRTAARKLLLDHQATRPLVPLYDLLTQSPTPSWYFDDNDTAARFTQQEGFPQGCPLSPLFSCLVLRALTTRLNEEQHQRARQRKHNGQLLDDGQGGLAHTASIMDDTSVCLPHADLPWFLRRLEELGAPLGIRLNKGKTHILSTTSGSSPSTSLSPNDKKSLYEALVFLDPNNPDDREITGGTRFLGQPVGSPSFARHFLHLRLQTMAAHIDLLENLPDLQTRSHLFRYSLIPSLTHLLAADIALAHPDPDSTTTIWQSPVTNETLRLIATFLSHVTTLPPTDITTMAITIAALPNRLGGIGYHNPTAIARPSLITQTARSIRLASSTEQPIPPMHRDTFVHWHDSERPWFQAFRRSIALFAHEQAPPFLTDPARFDQTTHRQLVHHTTIEHVLPALIQATPPELRASLPSTLSPLTSLALHLPRTAEAFRMDNAIFRTALRRKLRLPVLPPHLCSNCICPASPHLDPEGDHLFSCTAAPKTALSNAIRDTTFDLLQHLAPRAGLTEDHFGVHLEPPGLAPQHSRNIRPADVGLLLAPPHDNEPFHYVALDITVPPPHSRDPLPDPADHNALALAASRPHQESARAKFCRDDDTASHLLSNGIYLLPFTVDHLGSLGSFAHNLLFHPDDNPHPFSSALPPTWEDPHFGRNSARSKSHPAAFSLYRELSHLPRNITAKATSRTPGFKYPEAHIASIGHFARASLAHSIVSSLATHLNKQISILQNREFVGRMKKNSARTLSHPRICPTTATLHTVHTSTILHITSHITPPAKWPCRLATHHTP